MEMSWPPLTVFIHLYGRLRNELVLFDASFTEIGDDVTVDYDGLVRCHSFEECCTAGACSPSAISNSMRLQVLQTSQNFEWSEHALACFFEASCPVALQGFRRVALNFCAFRLFVTCVDVL